MEPKIRNVDSIVIKKFNE